MNSRISNVLDSIGKEYEKDIEKGARNYLEVSVGERAAALGYRDLESAYAETYAIVPLKAPRKGMKVRIDGRTFVDYAEFDPGIAVPGYLAREVGRAFKTFVPNDSMICNFS